MCCLYEITLPTSGDGVSITKMVYLDVTLLYNCGIKIYIVDYILLPQIARNIDK